MHDQNTWDNFFPLLQLRFYLNLVKRGLEGGEEKYYGTLGNRSLPFYSFRSLYLCLLSITSFLIKEVKAGKFCCLKACYTYNRDVLCFTNFLYLQEASFILCRVFVKSSSFDDSFRVFSKFMWWRKCHCRHSHVHLWHIWYGAIENDGLNSRLLSQTTSQLVRKCCCHAWCF